jgi:subtilisin-like proprotein convertase family protein
MKSNKVFSEKERILSFLLIFEFIVVFMLVPLIGNCQNCGEIKNQIGSYVQYARLDNSSIGLIGVYTNSEIFIPTSDNFKIADISLDLELQHDFVGDLVISITSPTGATIILQNKTLGTTGTDGLYKNYSKTDLGNFLGLESSGTWKLTIKDDIPKSDGELKYWSLTFYPEKETSYQIEIETQPPYITTGEQQKSTIIATISDNKGNLVDDFTGVLFTTNLGVITGLNPPASMALPNETIYFNNLPKVLSMDQAPSSVRDLIINTSLSPIEEIFYNQNFIYFNTKAESKKFLLQNQNSTVFPSILLKTNKIFFGASGETAKVDAHIMWNIPAGQPPLKVQFGFCTQLEVLDGVYKNIYADELVPITTFTLTGKFDQTVNVLDYQFAGWEPNLVYRFFGYILDETGQKIISKSFESFNFGRGNSVTLAGKAEATLRPIGGKEGIAIVTASCLGASKEAQVTIGSEPQVQIRAEPNQILYDGRDTAEIFVTIKDKAGRVVEDGTPVEFRSIFGTVSPSTVNTVAGAAQALFKSSDPGSQFVGTEIATVTARVSSLNVEGSTDITLKSYSLDVYPESTTIPGDGNSSTRLTAVLKDYFCNAIVGREISFSSDAGVISIYEEDNKINITNATGKAFAILTSERGTMTAKPSGRYVNEEDFTRVGFIGAALTISVDPRDILADNNSKANITVELQDAASNPIEGETVDIYIIRDGPPQNGVLDLGDGDGILEYGEDWEDINGDGLLDTGEYNPLDAEPILIYKNNNQKTDIYGKISATISSSVPGNALVMAFAGGVYQSGSLVFTEVIKFKVIAGEDIDGDGKSDFINEDLNGDGIFQISEDLDEDGNFDVGEDLNSNGLLDPGELDWDQDGIADTTEDLNGDNVFDAPSIEFGGKKIRITAGLLVNGGSTKVEDGTIIEFGSTMGDFDKVMVPMTDGIASTNFISRFNVGTSTITAVARKNQDQDANPDNDLKQDLTTSVKVGITAGDVAKILLYVSPNNVRIGANQAELSATCLDTYDNPVSNAVVSFKIIDGPGGGESINPGTNKTDATGTAKSILYSGNMSSSKNGVQIQASVVQQSSTLVKSEIKTLTISGLTYSVTFGRDFSLTDNENGTWSMFVSAIAVDINGNPVADGTKVNFSEKPIRFDKDRNSNCIMDTEDVDGDRRLDINEDLNGNNKFDRIQNTAKDQYDEDLDGDGHFDVGEDILRINYKLDIDEDIDKDGILDLTEATIGPNGTDIDNDGKIDAVNEDEALPGTPYYKNGLFDPIDKDGDGFYDEDLDKDRHFDTGEDTLRINRLLDPGEDLNNNGKLDLNEDANGNHILDPGEDFDGDGHLDVGEDGINNFKVDGILNTEDVDGKGTFSNTYNYWDDILSKCITTTCGGGGMNATTEDKNGNGILDYGEDLNGNGILDPEDGAVIDSFGFTKDGVCTVVIVYLEKHVWNIEIEVTAEADGRKGTDSFLLPKIAGDKYCGYGWEY